MKFSLKQVEVFLAVAETLSLTRASERLYLTVPAVSKQLRNLETQCGRPLYRVVGKQVHLSGFGESLVPAARELWRAGEQFSAQMVAKPPEEVAPISLSLGNTYQRIIFRLLAEFKRIHPDIMIDLKVAIWNVQQRIMQRQLDWLHISGEPKVSTADYHVEPLFSTPFVMIVSPEHPLCQYSEVTVSHICAHSFVLSTSISESQGKIRDWLSGLNLEKAPLMLDSFESVQHAVEANLGVAYLPEVVVAEAIEAKRLVKLMVAGVPALTGIMSLVYHRNLVLSRQMLTLIEFFRHCWKD